MEKGEKSLSSNSYRPLEDDLLRFVTPVYNINSEPKKYLPEFEGMTRVDIWDAVVRIMKEEGDK